MSEMNINQVLAQMRAMSLQANNARMPETGNGGADFSAMLKQTLDAVNETQQASGNMTKAFETGDAHISLAEVMVATQKASVSFQGMLQVRNKLVEAYKDVMNMPV
jgi:flagellar hook-basal body complex protein FliE